MLKYLLGFLSNLFNKGVSLFALIDHYSNVSNKARVYSRNKVWKSTIGDYTYVGERSSIVNTDIGKFCSIAGEVLIGLSSHTINFLSTSPLFTEKRNGTGSSWCDEAISYPYKRVEIGNDVWIGARAMIMGGIKIGNGAVVGAGAVVTKDVPPYAIVVGIPAKIIRYRFPDEIVDKLENLQWWNLPDSVLRKNIHHFQTGDVSEELIEKIQIER